MREGSETVPPRPLFPDGFQVPQLSFELPGSQTDADVQQSRTEVHPAERGLPIDCRGEVSQATGAV